MDRLVARTLDLLSDRTPAVHTLAALADELRAARVAVTESVLERSLADADATRLLDPWRGANRGLPASRGRRPVKRDARWVCLTPSIGAEEAELPRTPTIRLEATAPALDRTVRTLAARIDRDSPVEMARWVRLHGEAVRCATAKAA